MVNMAALHLIDLNLLVALDCLYRHRNVSSAAAELGITQSALSHALVKLRAQYQDPLFVRVSKGVAPTEFALGLQREVEEFVARAHRLSERVEVFDPGKAQGRIVVWCTDFFESVAGAPLLKRLQREAPDLQLAFHPFSGAFPKNQLEEGQCDLAIAGYFEDLPEGFYRQTLFSDPYATTWRKGHPRIGRKLSVEDFF